MKTMQQIADYLRGAEKRAMEEIDDDGEVNYARAFGRLRGACLIAATSIEMIQAIDDIIKETRCDD